MHDVTPVQRGKIWLQLQRSGTQQAGARLAPVNPQPLILFTVSDSMLEVGGDPASLFLKQPAHGASKAMFWA